MLRDISPFKTKFLLAVLPDVAFDGWTDELMQRTAERLKIPAHKIDMEFPHGARDLAIYFSLWATDETVKKMKKARMADMRVRDRIAFGVKTRLEILAPYKPAVGAAMPLMNVSLPKLVWHAADKIWWAAGDTATDYDHYTKRMLLSGVLTSTTLYWLNDASKGHAQTWTFLDRRIDEVLKIGQKIAQFRNRKKAG